MFYGLWQLYRGQPLPSREIDIGGFRVLNDFDGSRSVEVRSDESVRRCARALKERGLRLGKQLWRGRRYAIAGHAYAIVYSVRGNLREVV